MCDKVCPVCDADDQPGGGLIFDESACGDWECCSPHTFCTNPECPHKGHEYD